MPAKATVASNTRRALLRRSIGWVLPSRTGLESSGGVALGGQHVPVANCTAFYQSQRLMIRTALPPGIRGRLDF
jgi:hypothetical protein